MSSVLGKPRCRLGLFRLAQGPDSPGGIAVGGAAAYRRLLAARAEGRRRAGHRARARWREFWAASVTAGEWEHVSLAEQSRAKAASAWSLLLAEL